MFLFLWMLFKPMSLGLTSDSTGQIMNLDWQQGIVKVDIDGRRSTSIEPKTIGGMLYGLMSRAFCTQGSSRD